MFVQFTWQDWQQMGMDKVDPANVAANDNKAKTIRKIINVYKRSADFVNALDANEYFNGNNPTVMRKVILKAQAMEIEVELPDGGKKKKIATRNKEIVGNRIPSNLFSHFVIQQNQYLLANGVVLEDAEMKSRLGIGFDKTLQRMGERAIIHGVTWGFWNHDHVEAINACADGMTGFVALVDESTQEPMVGIQFWQVATNKPMYVRLFELDGVTVYRSTKDSLEITEPKRAYVQTSRRDALGVVSVTGQNYKRLPIVPLYANDDKRSELTVAIKNKIDLYDTILSDFGDNLERTNDIYWVLNNYGGSTKEIAAMIRMMEELKVVRNQSDGMQSSSAEPKTFEVPYQARQTALDLLRRELYSDFMALDMNELTGGSLTNVAIQAAMTNLNLKCDRYEWQVFDFVQQVLELAGIETESIRFVRQTIANKSEIMDDIYKAASDLDIRTRLKLNPYIMQEEIDNIVANREAEKLTQISSIEELEEVANRVH